MAFALMSEPRLVGFFLGDRLGSHILMINSGRYLIWIGSDTFGPTITELIHRNLGPERLTLWDSKKRGMVRLSSIPPLGHLRALTVGGRPDVMKLVKETYVSWGAEVVFITSNYRGNQEIMEGCKKAGIPAFVRRLVPGIPSLPKPLPDRERCGIFNKASEIHVSGFLPVEPFFHRSLPLRV